MNDTVLVLLRHFPSAWNDPKVRRFTGWLDIELAPGSYEQGIQVGQQLARKGLHFDQYYTSTLKRATRSLDAVLEGMELSRLVTVRDERLNERHYGILQGLLHDDVIARYGEKQVHAWRRGFSKRLPGGESLEDTRQRVAAFWNDDMVPILQQRKCSLVVAHGNSLRALVMHFTGMSSDEIERFEIPTGKPLVCTFESETLCLRHMEYL